MIPHFESSQWPPDWDIKTIKAAALWVAWIQKKEVCVSTSLHFPEKSPAFFYIPIFPCIVLACPDGWGLKDANVHVGATDLPWRLTLHQWERKPVIQQAAVALIPTHHSLWHCQPRQEHINHKHRPPTLCCRYSRVPSIYPFSTDFMETTHTEMMRWKQRLTTSQVHVNQDTMLNTQFIKSKTQSFLYIFF